MTAIHFQSGRDPRGPANQRTVSDLYPLPVSIGEITSAFTSFNQLGVAEQTPIIELKSNYGLSALRDEVTVTGAGSVVNAAGDGEYAVSTGATANSTARLRTVEFGRYVAGSDGLAGVGIRVPVMPTGDQFLEWGYYVSTSGFGVGVDADGLYSFKINGSKIKTRREDWDDPLDGTGPSGVNIDLQQVNVFQFRYRWYGSGPIVYYASAIVDNVPVMVPFRVCEPADQLPVVPDPNLPITIDAHNGAGGGDIKCCVYGRNYAVLGRYRPNRRLTSDRRIARTAIGDTIVPMVSFQQKASYRSVSAKLAGLNIITNEPLLWELRVFSALTGASFGAPTGVPATETALEFDIAATAISGGQVIARGLLGAGGPGQQTATGAFDIPELDVPVNGIVSLAVRRVGSSNATASAVLTAREEW